MAITIEEMCKRLKPELGKKMEMLYLKYSMAEDREEKWEIEQALNILYEKHLNTTLLQEKILLEPPEEDMVEGEYNIGVVIKLAMKIALAISKKKLDNNSAKFESINICVILP